MKHYKPVELELPRLRSGRLSCTHFRDEFAPHLEVHNSTRYNNIQLRDLMLIYLDEHFSGYVLGEFRKFIRYSVPKSYIDYMHSSGVFGLVELTINGEPYFKFRDTERADVPDEYREIAIRVI